MVGGKLAAKGVAIGAKTIYGQRAEIGKAATVITKAAATTVAVAGYGAYRIAEWGVKKVAKHRREIGGASVGVVTGLGQALVDTTAHAYARENSLRPLIERIAAQSAEYREQISRLYGRLDAIPSTVRGGDVKLDTIVVGGNTLADYVSFAANVPADVERAYRLAYPNLASHHSFVEEVRSLDSSQLPGFISGVKGKLFEMEYTDYLNDGHLLAGYSAELAASATQPGWDIKILGPDERLSEIIQAKATDSVAYVKEALARYPHIDVVTTDEVHSQLVMQGFSDHVIESGISDAA